MSELAITRIIYDQLIQERNALHNARKVIVRQLYDADSEILSLQIQIDILRDKLHKYLLDERDKELAK